MVCVASFSAELVPEKISRDEAKKLVNPIPYSKASITQGKSVYIRGTCHECHDMDGRSLKGSDLAKAADLTAPKGWQFGASDGEIFVDIRDGTPAQMPAFKKLNQDQVWHLINYIRSIGPAELRPKMTDDPPAKAAEQAPASAPSEKPDPASLKNPIAYTRLSIARGKGFYLRATCVECHDLDGRSLKGSDLAKASNLTDPRTWKFGKTDGHLFTAIKSGTSEQMPGFATKLQDDQIWHLVNYLRSIGPEDARLKLVETAP